MISPGFRRALKKHSTRITARDIDDDGQPPSSDGGGEGAGPHPRSERVPRLMTSVAVNTYTHSVTYVADNILKSLKDIIRLSGLDPGEVRRRLGEQHARRSRRGSAPAISQKVILEIYNPKTDALIVALGHRHRLQLVVGDGSFWTDTEQLKYAHPQGGRRAERGQLSTAAAHQARPPRRRRLGARRAIARPTAWFARASARPSSTAASAAAPPTGGRA